MTLFDAHIMVDWSARNNPGPRKPSPNSIWWAVARDDKVEKPEYARTRHEAIERLSDLIATELDHERRVLVGFDFPFGYPAGVAKHLTGSSSALDLWHWIDCRIEDDAKNCNNRFEVAERINRKYPGKGPFWGHHAAKSFEELPRRESDRICQDVHPPEYRIADRRAKGAKTVWQLFYAGSVGSQVLVGLPALNCLISDPRIHDRVAIWPFQTGLRVPDKPVVIAEIYPSLLKSKIDERRRGNEIIDRAQVRVNAEIFAWRDKQGCLEQYFKGPKDLTHEDRRRIETEEGWILGIL